MIIEEIATTSILTRTGGFLATVCSHSLQPYGGCGLGRSLCGVGCYAKHQTFLTRGRPWGEYLDVKTGAARLYRSQYEREAAWARRKTGQFGVFLSSSTEPFPPQEKRYGVTASVLTAMLEAPPGRLILQTHGTGVLDVLAMLRELNDRCELRVHMSIESDQDRLPGLPGSFATVKARIEAIGKIRAAGIRSVVTVSPLLPIRDPHGFFRRLAEVADAVVLDHFIGGDGSANGSRTHRTALPEAMRSVDPASVRIEYRDSMAEIATRYFPGRVGIGPDGFAGRYLNDPSQASSETSRAIH